MSTEEIHPFKLYTPPDSDILIVGTFPPTRKNWSYDFFYPNKQNLFWKIMAQIAGEDLRHFSGEEAVEERKRILTFLNVAITDMGLKVSRLGESSLDENLTAIEYTDIFEILERNPLIKRILFTSSSGKVSAAQWFSNYLQQKKVIHRFPKGSKPLKSELTYNGRSIELVILYSPSRRAANRISLDNLVEMYRREIRTPEQ
jgi:G:T/U-mismatch repair DNA glycosylase